MPRQLMFGTVWAAALAAAVSAQSNGQPSGQQDPNAGSRRNGNQTVTVTGCLQSGGTSASSGSTASGASPRTGASGTGAEFILTNVSSSSGAGSRTGSSGTGTPSSTGSTGSAGAPAGNPGTPSRTGAEPGASTSSGAAGVSAQQTYRLTGNMGEMNKLVNRRVEVTGTIENQSGNPSGSGATSSTGGSPSGTGSTGSAGTPSTSPAGERASDMHRMSGDAPRLRVTSIHEVQGGPSCTPAGQP